MPTETGMPVHCQTVRERLAVLERKVMVVSDWEKIRRRLGRREGLLPGK
jgi:hypothetical protein